MIIIKYENTNDWLFIEFEEFKLRFIKIYYEI